MAAPSPKESAGVVELVANLGRAEQTGDAAPRPRSNMRRKVGDVLANYTFSVEDALKEIKKPRSVPELRLDVVRRLYKEAFGHYPTNAPGAEARKPALLAALYSNGKPPETRASYDGDGEEPSAHDKLRAANIRANAIKMIELGLVDAASPFAQNGACATTPLVSLAFWNLHSSAHHSPNPTGVRFFLARVRWQRSDERRSWRASFRSKHSSPSRERPGARRANPPQSGPQSWRLAHTWGYALASSSTTRASAATLLPAS
jgi:hypothetical protein